MFLTKRCKKKCKKKRFRNSEDGGGVNYVNDEALFNDGASLTSLEAQF